MGIMLGKWLCIDGAVRPKVYEARHTGTKTEGVDAGRPASTAQLVGNLTSGIDLQTLPILNPEAAERPEEFTLHQPLLTDLQALVQRISDERPKLKVVVLQGQPGVGKVWAAEFIHRTCPKIQGVKGPIDICGRSKLGTTQDQIETNPPNTGSSR